MARRSDRHDLTPHMFEIETAIAITTETAREIETGTETIVAIGTDIQTNPETAIGTVNTIKSINIALGMRT